MAFSPDGRWLASAGADKAIILWDVKSGRLLRVFQGHSAMVTNVVFSPDGRRVASSSLDHTVRLWDPESGNIVRVLSLEENVAALALSKDGSLLATGCGFRVMEGGCRDSSIKLWDLASGNPIKELSGHKTGVRALAFDAPGHRLASGGEDRTVRLWDVQKGEEIWSVKVPLGAYAISFSADGTILAAQENTTVHILDAATGRERHSLAQPYGGFGVAFSADGLWLASSGAEPALTVWSRSSWTASHRAPGRDFNCRGTAFSPDSKLLATACSDNTAKIFALRPFRLERTFGRSAPFSD